MTIGKYLYQQIYIDIVNMIKSGKLRIGDSLPSVSDLTEQYKVSPITVNTALNSLKSDGYIQRVKGHGSFVISRDVPDESEMFIMQKPVERADSKGTIGVIMEHVSSGFGLDYIYALDELAHKHGYTLLTRFSFGNRQRENEEILFLKSAKVKGFVCMPCHGKYFNTEIVKLILEGRPVVLFDKQMKGIPVSSVRTNNYESMGLLVSWLYQRGRKHIGYVTVDDAFTSSVKARNRAFRDKIAQYGLPKLPECMLSTKSVINIYSDSFHEEIGQQIQKYMDDNPQMDGIIFEEYGFLRQLKMTRSQLLSQIDACCFDEDYLSPGEFYVTHIRQDERALAEKTMEVLLGQIDQEVAPELKDYLVPGKLCEENLL